VRPDLGRDAPEHAEPPRPSPAQVALQRRLADSRRSVDICLLLLLAAVLVFVINRRSFGWTMGLDPSPGILLQGVALAVLAALLAGLYPAWRMARGEPAGALRDE
jgi:hypothetical protein